MILAPRGKNILIGSEDVEVWSRHCVDGHRCIQCFFEGKIKCAPRFWLYPLVYLPSLPTKEGFYLKRALSLDAPIGEFGETIADFLPGQPIIPIPDGGSTEEATNNLIVYETRERRFAPYRDTDQPCIKCGYPYLHFYQTRRNRNRYECPRCGARQMEDTNRKPKEIKTYLRELWGQGIPIKEINIRIRSRYGVSISYTLLRGMRKSMGLPTRKPGGRR